MNPCQNSTDIQYGEGRPYTEPDSKDLVAGITTLPGACLDCALVKMKWIEWCQRRYHRISCLYRK